MKSVGIILAAGRGVRLGNLTAEIPKGLLEIAGMSLIARQVQALRAFDIKDIYAVTGFAADKMKQAFGKEIKYIFNPRWDTANNIYSLYLAGEIAADGFVLINSDDFFHRGILENLLKDGRPDAINVDDFKKLGEEEMKVKLEDGFLRKINKTMDPASAQGEYIGIAKFGAEGAKELFEILDDFVRRDDLDGWYEEAFDVLADKRPIVGVSTGGLPWIEIDTPQDLEMARKEVVAAIAKECK